MVAGREYYKARDPEKEKALCKLDEQPQDAAVKTVAGEKTERLRTRGGSRSQMYNVTELSRACRAWASSNVKAAAELTYATQFVEIAYNHCS